MAEVYFYHLEQTPLSSILPDLLLRGLKRGLRLAVEAPAPENLQRLSDMLWSVEDVAFIPHGMDGEDSESHPILLCTSAANQNAATYRFYVEGALPDSISGLDRALIMIDSNSEDALASARNEWKKRKAEGHAVSYWKMDERGKWQNLA